MTLNLFGGRCTRCIRYIVGVPLDQNVKKNIFWSRAQEYPRMLARHGLLLEMWLNGRSIFEERHFYTLDPWGNRLQRGEPPWCIPDPLLWLVPRGIRGMLLEVTSVRGGHVSIDRVFNTPVVKVFGRPKATPVWGCAAFMDSRSLTIYIFNKIWVSMV